MNQGRVVAVGSDQDVMTAMGSDCPTVDMGGRVVLPGLTDAHIHWCTYALMSTELALEPTMSLGEVLRAVRSQASMQPVGTWVVGRGWDHSRWSGWPSANELDGAAPHHRVVLTRIDGHVVWLNSNALAAAGVSHTTPDPAGGEIVRRDGVPTGILKENALRLVNEAVPEPSPAERQAAMVAAWPDAWCRGITSCHDMGFRDTALFRDLSTLRESGELGLRFVWYFPREALPEAMALGLASGMGDEWLRVGGMKLYLDGSLGAQSAHMLAPYHGRDGGLGIPAMTPDEFAQSVATAASAGIATAVHAIGDGANRVALDGFAQLRTDDRASRRRLRHRIEHAQLLDPSDMPRFRDLGVVASMQPVHAVSDMALADAWWGARSASAYAWRSLLDAGARLAFGSDAPIEPMDAIAGIHAAVNRRTVAGDPPEGWRPEQCVTVEEALAAYTTGSAFASGQENEAGCLAPGNPADLIVLDRDPMAMPLAELASIRVRATMIEGVWVWQAPDVDLGGPRHAG
jgi:hypothetical protein